MVLFGGAERLVGVLRSVRKPRFDPLHGKYRKTGREFTSDYHFIHLYLS